MLARSCSSAIMISLALLASAAACRSEQACLELRQQGFDVINGAHPCNDDSDCRSSEWPACARPLNARSEARLHDLMRKSRQAGCDETLPRCADEHAAYCDRNLCIARQIPFTP